MAKVKNIIDGDTFMTNSGERIRLAEVDAPERGAPYSAQATEHLADLIEDKNVQIKKVARISTDELSRMSPLAGWMLIAA